MVQNAVENLRNQNVNIEEYEKDKKDIKIGFEVHSSSYTRNGWDGYMTLDGYKLNISKDYCGEKEANYINNALKNINSYSKISLGEVNDCYEFEVVYLDCYDVNEEKKYIINPREAESVKLIYEMSIAGNSRSEIINELNERGFKTKVGTMFKVNSIHSILTNEKYTGVYIYNRSAKKDAFGKRNSHSYKDESEIIRIEGGIPAIVSKEDFEKVQEILKMRRKKPGTNKAKENYLLTGLIRCGCCQKPYQGNRRHAKNKPMYVSYRCSFRQKTSSKVCDNKEIRKEYIEEYILSELERKIFNDKAITYIAEGINKNLQKQNNADVEKKAVLIKQIDEVEGQINNIVTAITNGFVQEEFKAKMDELKSSKSELEAKLSEIEAKDINKIVTEADVRSLLSNFSGYVISRNIPECKKFIRDFVKEVIVYKEHIEVIFNVSFSLLKNSQGVKVTSQISRYDLYDRYSQSFYIKVS